MFERTGQRIVLRVIAMMAYTFTW